MTRSKHAADVLPREANPQAAQLADTAARLRDALDRDPDAHAVRYQLALLEAQLGHWIEAERLARCVAVDGGAAYAGALGQILAEQGRGDEAHAWLAQALAANPGDASAHAWLGAVHAGRGDWTAAVNCFERALSIRGDFEWARVRRDQAAFLRDVQTTYVAYACRRGFDPDPATAGAAIVEFPSASVDASGNPRFVMTLPSPLILGDLGAANLFYREIGGRGWEFALRCFIDASIDSDDVFIDVGAHWGVHALTAATRRPTEVSVLAIEAHPGNAERLRGWVELNRLGKEIAVVSAAAGDREGQAQLLVDRSSMGYQLSGGVADAGSRTIDVDLTTIDRQLSARAGLRWRRVLMKIDVEGYELEVLAGAKGLLATGDVAAVVWEKGVFHDGELQRQRDAAIFALLDGLGFEHFRFADEDAGGPLLPLADRDATCNVYSLARGFRREPVYS
ncbi:MAG: FkbM family methyltransferase [Burkholderiales bacterium]